MRLAPALLPCADGAGADAERRAEPPLAHAERDPRVPDLGWGHLAIMRSNEPRCLAISLFSAIRSRSAAASVL